MKKLNIVLSHKLSFYKTVAFTTILGLFFAFSSCTKSSSNSNTSGSLSSNPNQVIMRNTSYNPPTLQISKGDTVTWINEDPFDHTVTSGTPGHPNGLFDSGNIGPNGKFTHVFDSVGTFRYYCRIHLDKMIGTIKVQ